MSQPFLGEIRMFGFNFAPVGWAFCNGQTMAISQNTALFSLIGTTYGGNGVQSFALPNLQSRVPIHQGQGLALSPYVIGQQGGVENVTLNSNQMPQHTHTPNCNTNPGDQRGPAGGVWAQEATGQTATYTQNAPNGTMSQQAIGMAGGNQPHYNVQPFLVVNFCIALQGIFPSRS